ncbi:hypothetical protein [Streptomyces sp. CNQ085]|uniref:hypothetical protein n=1 Tax=Streptomyces sp. CNQ085 TaxID=2886944 RepID=UPI0035AE7847
MYLPSWCSHAPPPPPGGPAPGLLAAVPAVTPVTRVESPLSAMTSGALGGPPVTGVAVRTSANIQAGAVSRNSTIPHGMHLHVGEAQAYALGDPGNGNGGEAPVLTAVRPGAAVA